MKNFFDINLSLVEHFNEDQLKNLYASVKILKPTLDTSDAIRILRNDKK